MCFAFISKLPNGAADLKQIKNAPAIFGAIFEFLKSVLSIASSYQPIINWAPTLLAILEDAGVEIWDDHQALEVARTKMGSVVEGADKLQAARQKWALGPMVCSPSAPFVYLREMLMCNSAIRRTLSQLIRWNCSRSVQVDQSRKRERSTGTTKGQADGNGDDVHK